MKIKVMEYNSLPFKEREITDYYVIESKIQEIDYICNKYKNDISPRFKSILNQRKKDLEHFLNENYEEMKNEKV